MARPKKAVVAVTESTPTKSPNDELTDLLPINYRKLQGEDFKEYQEIESELLMNEKYDYEMWLATYEVEFDLDRKTGKPIQKMVGITIHGSEPIQLSRMTAAQARELNSHVKTGAPERQNSKYYLLAKPKAELVEDKA